MPQRYWRERGCVVVVFEGSYRVDVALDSIASALAEDPAPSAGLLLDLSESESFRARSSDALRLVADFLALRRDRFASHLATVGTSDLTYGLLRMGEVFASEHGLVSQTFRTRDEALDWLVASA